MLGVKSTLSSLIDDLRELFSKEGLGGRGSSTSLVEILLLDPSRLANRRVTFPLSSCMIERDFLTLIGFGRANYLKFQVFEWVKDSQGISSRIMVEECSSLDWNNRVFPLGEINKHFGFTKVVIA